MFLHHHARTENHLVRWLLGSQKKTPNAFFRLAICRCDCMSKYGWKFGLKQHTHNREMIFLGEKHRERLRRNHNIEKELSWRRSRCGAKKPPSTTCEQYKETFSACACGRATTTTMEWGREIFTPSTRVRLWQRLSHWQQHFSLYQKRFSHRKRAKIERKRARKIRRRRVVWEKCQTEMPKK